MCGFYHQDERDAAVNTGCLAVLAMAAIGVILAIVLACIGITDSKPMDGSNAGANAVTPETLAIEPTNGKPPNMG